MTDHDTPHDDDCVHVSYTEQAGGWIACDDCGKDVTREIIRAEMKERE